MAIRKKLLSALLIACLISTALSAKAKKKKGFTSSAQAETTAASDNTETSASDNDSASIEEDTSDSNDSDRETPAEQGWQMLEWDEETPEWVMKYEVVIEQRTDENSP